MMIQSAVQLVKKQKKDFYEVCFKIDSYKFLQLLIFKEVNFNKVVKKRN